MKKQDTNTIRKKSMGVKTSRIIANTIIYAILVLMTIVWLFPFFGLVLESFRVEIPQQVGYFWPKEFGFDNYVKLFTQTDFLRWFGNTAFIGVATAVLQTVFVLMMSYTLSDCASRAEKH